jgi:hypothetical protein
MADCFFAHSDVKLIADPKKNLLLDIFVYLLF